MEREELLLHGKSKIGTLNFHDDDDDVELFSHRRTTNQRRMLECCTSLLVFLCLTLLATSIIFGVRYLSVKHSLYVLEQEHSQQQQVKPIEHSSSTDSDDDVIQQLQNRISDLESELANCRNEIQNHETSEINEETSSIGNTPAAQRLGDDGNQKPCLPQNNEGNSASFLKVHRYGLLLPIMTVLLQYLMTTTTR
uniref:uncharacterized protein LOC120343823 n=1 Tax=Styela clava TaxID=7725 RepID=UPI00193A5C36|nr:uncharacterized protein LOC120343823 [Styela clava]